MAGYNGFSMSNNAVAAYEDGEKPLSKCEVSYEIFGASILSSSQTSVINFSIIVNPPIENSITEIKKKEKR